MFYWAALETIDYFLKNGSEVFTCATVMSNAFDLTLHSLMFSKMLDAGLSASSFTVKNGCGQGKVLAAIAYCMYCEELFQTLRRKRSGCWAMGKFAGIFGYSDDNWLIAPSLPPLL